MIDRTEGLRTTSSRGPLSRARISKHRRAAILLGTAAAALLAAKIIRAQATSDSFMTLAPELMVHVIHPGAGITGSDVSAPSPVVSAERTTGRTSAGLVIVPTFDVSITSDPNAAAIEAAINTAIDNVTSQFSDPITVNINFAEGGGLGSSSTYFATGSYASFLAALKGDAKTSDDATAVGLLPNVATNPVNGTTTINVKTANLRAVGIMVNPPPGQPDGFITLNTTITNPGSPGSSLTYNLIPVIEHEIDEVLGLGSSLPSVPAGTIFPQDLYRYVAGSTRTFTTTPGLAFFSIDAATSLAQFDQQFDGGDFGDWQSNPLPSGVSPKVQDAFATPGANPALGPELNALDVIGYDRVGTGAPSITTQPASQSIASGSTATMSVVATGTPPLGYQWYVGTSGNTASPIGGAISSTFTTPVLNTTTSYWVRVSNGAGHADSNTAVITVTGLPIVVTGAASGITPTSATLNGTVNPNNLNLGANTFFQYGTTTSYGSVTPTFVVNAGTAAVAIPGGAISGLTCNTLYHFRGVAGNANGQVVGADATFTTTPCTPPTVTTTFPTGFTPAGALLNGTVNPNGNATTAWFQYGLTTAYGSLTPTLPVGAGTLSVAILGGGVSLLTCDTVYHFRAVAQNANGTSVGSDQVFSPPCAGAISPSLYAVSNDTVFLRVFNASTLAPVVNIPVPVSSILAFDVVVTPNQSLAYAARTDGIYVIDLTLSPPALASGLNPIPVPAGMPFVEDLSLTRDGRFLVASDGSATAPISVIDTSTRGVVGSLNVLGDHNSVEVCDNGSVLVTNILTGTNVVRRLTISSTGALSDTGQSLVVAGAGPNNTACGPGGAVGVVVNRATGDLRSFIVNGMTAVSTQVLPGSGLGLNVAISPDGGKVFGRRQFDNLTAYNFNSTTGVIGGQLWSTKIGTTMTFFGADQVALDPGGRRVFASTSGFVLSLNAATGAINGSAAATSPVGIALKRRAGLEGDYDGDGRDDLSLYRPSTGTWYVDESSGAFLIQAWGLASDIALRGDYDGDGRADLALYRPSTGVWYILKSSTNFTTFITQPFGLATDIPVPGDYDGDGKSDLALFRPSTATWYVLLSSTNYATALIKPFGLGTDVPVPGDYDGDGKTDLGVFRPSTATWYVLLSGANYTTALVQPWGLGTDVPVPGDYDGDGKTDPAVFRPSTGTWYLLQSSTNYTTFVAQAWGLGSDTIVPGDYDGDGKTDLGLYRPSTGVWYLLTSGSGFLTAPWGLATDVAVLKRP